MSIEDIEVQVATTSLNAKIIQRFDISKLFLKNSLINL